MGTSVGAGKGSGVGTEVGIELGSGDGRLDGSNVGTGVGSLDGGADIVGKTVGSFGLQSLTESKLEASVPVVVPEGQAVQVSPEPRSASLKYPSGQTEQSVEAEEQ